MQPAVEIPPRPQLFISHLPHARHDPHAQHHINGVRTLDANLGQRGAGRSHQVGDHIHRAAAHGPGAEGLEFAVHLPGGHPIIGRPRLLGGFRAHKRAVLAARYIRHIGPVVITAGQLLLVELDQHPLRHGFLRQQLFLGGGAVTPKNVVRLAKFGHFVHPSDDNGIGGVWF